jgi:hypothetical protein
VDLAAWILPNPSHPLWRDFPWTEWLTTRPGGFAENVASIPIVVLIVIATAAVAARWRASRYWIGFTTAFVLLSLGPFIRVAGIDTFVPTPWALLRFVPVVEWARTPTRFTAVAMVGISVLFALAVAALCRRWPHWRPGVLGAAGVVLAVELLPVPRALYAATAPAVYRTITTDTRPIRVLEIPYGIRDGFTNAGDFSAATLFNQTFHGKPVFGGYLSRVSPSRVERARRRPVMSVILALSEGREVTEAELTRAREAVPSFLKRFNLGYVVVDRTRTTPAATQTLVELLSLVQVDRGPRRTLYVPRMPKAAGPPGPSNKPQNTPGAPAGTGPTGTPGGPGQATNPVTAPG